MRPFHFTARSYLPDVFFGWPSAEGMQTTDFFPVVGPGLARSIHDWWMEIWFYE